ncbi:unnamed protein product [Clonostachys rhizophaga]|uniref:ATPase AAA-type core domain-containing protein n=1 Tax=Clonostachys rhizophaga TaxID=160324 RepID=A0A9N9YLK8_9HYPO|nr:unnamed protein product [Clonostachys rhizophaga]
MSTYEANLNQGHEEVNLRSDPSEASSKPDSSGASSKPDPNPDPSEASSKPDSSGASSKPDPNPDSSGASSKPDPSEASSKPDPNPDSSGANSNPDSSGASSKPDSSGANSNPDPSFIAIAGHICNEWTTWPITSHRISQYGGRIQERSLKCTHELRGAPLLNKLLSEARGYHEHKVIATNQQGRQESNNKLLIDLIPKKSDPTKYQLEKYRHFPESCTLYFPQYDPNFRTRILVIEEPPAPSYYGKGSEESYKKFVRGANPQLIIYKMTRPLADGELWRTIRSGTKNKPDEEATKNLIVIVDADDLRAEGVELSRHLSWERTADDFVRNIASNGEHGTVVSCAHLIVRFGCEGAIYYQGQKKSLATLLCSSEKAEGNFIQSQSEPMVGLSTAFTAGLVSSLAKDKSLATSDTQSQGRDCIHTLIKRGIVLGLWNADRLASQGFWRTNIETDREAPLYPSLEITDHITMSPESLMKSERIVYTEIPTARSLRGERWSILDETIGDITEAAYRIIKTGPQKVLSHVPTASFGKLITADKNEIESFHSITNLVREYLRASRMSLAEPLSIGVFGPPGSGKSFGVMQVIETAAKGRRDVEKLSFNLSQFANYSELVAAFQLIRDRTLSGVLPLVLFDEFDAGLPGSSWGWLKYFLSPMQDGEFLDHGTMHPLGAAIFVFIGGTSPTFSAFKKMNDDSESTKFAAAKGPDFISRLRGYVNVVGTDPSDDDDKYPIRRAILLRALLEKRFNIEQGQEIKVDPTVANALLNVPKFHHGARSLEAILSMSRLQAQREFQRAALPSETQLTLHVNSQEFMERVRRRKNLQPRLREQIAEKLHREFRDFRRKEMEKMRRRQGNAGSLNADEERNADSTTVPWDRLPENLRESNRLAADDIVIKLRMIQCYMTKKTLDGRNAIIANY